MTVDITADYFMPGQAPSTAVTNRQTAVLFMADDLAAVEASPSKRRRMAQTLCFHKWLVLRGVINDEDGTV